MGENVIHRRVRPAPACSAQGGTLAVLSQKLGAGEQRDEGLVLESYRRNRIGWDIRFSDDLVFYKVV